MPSIGTSARAILQRDGKLLVIRYRDEHGDHFALPGGSQQHGESLTEAVVREVAEETGGIVRAGNLRFVRECRGSPQSQSLPPDWHTVELFFECELISDARHSSAPDRDQVEAIWLSTSELRSRCFYPQALLDALEDGREFGYLGMV